MAGSAGAGGRNAWEAASLVCRIATVGLSLASAIMTAASTKCLYRSDGSPAGSVSYSHYGSFKYSALANLLSAALQGVAIWLEVLGKEGWSKTVDLIDKLVLALTSTSAPLLLAVDNITSCGGGGDGRRSRSVCDQAGSFCRQLRFASLPSIASVGSAAGVQYTRWRTAVSSEVAQTPGRRGARTPPPPPGPAGAVAEDTGGGGPGTDDGNGGGAGDGGRHEPNQGTMTIYKDPKGKENSEGAGGDDGHDGGNGDGPKPKDEGDSGESKPEGGEIMEDRRGEKTQEEKKAADRSVTTREHFKGKMKYETYRKDKGDRGGEDKAGDREVEDHREDQEIQVEEADPVPPGRNAIVIRRTRG